MSFWEMLVIIIVAFIVIKPERLPEVAYLLGKWLGQFRIWYHNLLRKYGPSW